MKCRFCNVPIEKRTKKVEVEGTEYTVVSYCDIVLNEACCPTRSGSPCLEGKVHMPKEEVLNE
jgi:hypothetical protein